MEILVRWSSTWRVTFKCCCGLPWRWGKRLSLLRGWTWYRGFELVFSIVVLKNPVDILHTSTKNQVEIITIKRNITQTFLPPWAELLCVPPKKPLGFCYSQLPSKGRKLYITFTPLTLELIICFTPHSPKHKCLGFATLSIEKAPYGGDKSITCSISGTLRPGYW